MFLIIIIGLALFAFVLDPSTLGDFFNSSKINEVGEVNGETISRQEFAEALENYQAQTGNRVSEMQASKTVWDNLVRQKLYKAQLEEAGITIGEQDIVNNLIEAPSVQSNPRFQTSGMFDKSKFLGFLKDAKEENKDSWKSLQNDFRNIGSNLQQVTYDGLITAGLGASLKEGELQYLLENSKVSSQFVYIPYASIADSLVTLKRSDVEKYIKANSEDFKTEATRDLKYVKYDIVATPEDEEAIKNEIAALIEDSEDRYKQPVKGLKNTTDYVAFLEENKSDSSLDENFKFKNDIFAEVSEELISKNVGEVFGPYKDRGFYKVSKITEVTQMPDSVQASHILIPFYGAQPSGGEPTMSEADAKIKADSILSVVKRNRSKFANMALRFSTDNSNAEKGGDLGWFNYSRMVPEFRNFCFSGKKGDIGVVKTAFGFHVIKIDGQKNKQKAVKLVTFSRKIVPSEATENTMFQNAEKFALEVSKGKTFDEVAKENNLTVLPAVGIKALDESVARLRNQRQIISWAFGKDIGPGDFKRFDIENGHVVAVVTNVGKKGLISVEKATPRVRPILLKEKKAILLEAKMNASTLADIAKDNNVTVKNASSVTLNAPTISGVGNEPKVVGAMSYAKENQLYSKIIGDKGVFAFVVTKKEAPTALPNYDTYRKRIATERKNQSSKMYEAIKNASKVVDDRQNFYGIE